MGNRQILVRADYGDGDIVGPFKASSGDDTMVLSAEGTGHHLARNGTLVWDGDNNRLSSGWRDEFGLSRSGAQLAADDYTLLGETAQKTIVDGASKITLHSDAGTIAQWYNVAQTAPRILRTVDWYPAASPLYVWLGGIVAAADTAIILIVHKAGDITNYIRMSLEYVAAAYQIQTFDAGGGAETSRDTQAISAGQSWVGIGPDPETPANYRVSYYEAAATDEVDPEEWSVALASQAWPWQLEEQLTVMIAAATWAGTPNEVNGEARYLNIPRGG